MASNPGCEKTGKEQNHRSIIPPFISIPKCDSILTSGEKFAGHPVAGRAPRLHLSLTDSDVKSRSGNPGLLFRRALPTKAG